MSGKELLRTVLYILIALASIATWIYSNHLTGKLAEKEIQYGKLWADAVMETEYGDLDGEISLIAYRILETNDMPVILMNDKTFLSYRNFEIDSSKITKEEFLNKKTKEMHSRHEPIALEYRPGQYDILYYDDSDTLKQLKIYPVIQLIVTIMIVLLSFVAVRYSTKADQNKILVGMSKETAHQLGTPISSLLAWIEILKMDNYNLELTSEVEKDVKRLEKITERFSRIGSKPELDRENICPILKNSVNYLESRTSQNINYSMEIPQNEIIVLLNVSLFEWVIENICKNAVDAMQGKGSLNIKLFEEDKKVCIEITDTGKGLLKRNFKTVFRPGFTTKKHGWGLGLSLAQRIITDYHKGKIFVKWSEIGKGTTFRIELPE
ncbi:MAG: HAMP domain-containing histidine kinase [Bacteroidales bacterium]|jgi:signal transduction histidine kinase|nr:HAMP domain-containing histidine kinase [Bacteroidales bacterium]